MSDEMSQDEVRYCPWDHGEAKKTDHKPDVNKDTFYYQCTNPECGRDFLLEEWPREATISSQSIERVAEIRSIDSKSYLLEGNVLCFYVDSKGMLSVSDADGKKPVAIVYKHSDEWWIVDLGCPKGIRINNKNVIHNAKLNWNDKISFYWEDKDNKFSSEQSEIAFRVTLTANGFELVKSFDEEKPICIKVDKISSKAAGRSILKDISVYAKSGDFIGILGPSGCGKSSLIQRIVGLAPIDKGSIIKINGMDLSDCKDQFLSICAYVPQQTTLHEPLTVEEECKNFAELNLPDSSSAKKSIDYILRLVGLEEEHDKEIRVLSGGQKKRLGIALELLRNPQVLLLDEPSSGLDPASETKIMEHLRSIADQGRIVFCATHTMDNVDKFDKVLILSQGEEIYFGTPDGAKKHFGVKSYQSIYNKLEEDSDDQKSQTTKSYKDTFNNSKEKSDLTSSINQNDKKSELPASNKTASQLSQFCAYIYRSILYYKRNRDWILQLVFQPILIAFVIKLACAEKIFGSSSADSSTELEQTYFFSLISMFWLGMNNSVRELVSQRYPGRCLERLEQVPLSVYLLSKWFIMSLICLIQTALFSIVLFSPFIQPPVKDASNQLAISPSVFLIFFGISIIGCLIGLMVSAYYKSQTSAVAMLPIIVIPVILLSKPVTGIDYPSEPVFTHIFIVAGIVAATLILLSIIAGLPLKCPKILTSMSFRMIFGVIIIAISYYGLLTYYNLLDKPEDKNYSVLAERVQTLSPCYMSLQLITEENKYARTDKSIKESEKEKKNAADKAKERDLDKDINSDSASLKEINERIEHIKPYYYLSLLAYAALCVTLTIVFQNAREKEWEGR